MIRQNRHYQWDVLLTTSTFLQGPTIHNTYTYTVQGPATPAGAITRALADAPRSIREHLYSASVIHKQPMS